MAYRFFAGVASNNSVAPDSPNSSRGTPRFQANWFKNFITTGAKPSSSSDLESHSEEVLRQQKHHGTETPLRQNSRQDS